MYMRRNLTANQMTSTIPAIWLTKQAFPSLESLLLTGNQLSGTLPVEASFEALLVGSVACFA